MNLKEHTEKYPLISSACPTIVRLIQIRFPNLLEHLLPISPPVEVAASIARKRAMEKTGLPREKIGIIFISPCPSKVTAMKYPLGMERSEIDAVCAIKEVYVKLLSKMKEVKEVEELSIAGKIGISWGTTGGEAGGLFSDDYLAADGIENVIRVLEDLEDQKFSSDLKFIELNACSGGCVGGVLTVENPYSAMVKMKRLRKYMTVACNRIENVEIPNKVTSSVPIREVLSNVISSQIELHKLYGGVVPEIASRKHIEAIYGLADQALDKAGLTRTDIDAVAVTYAPGLIGAVLVGVNFAKAAALTLNKPLIPVHHIKGHIAANYLAFPELKPPFLCLVVSGGHTMLVDVQDYTKMQIMGTTLDDAAGECFDKVARVLGMPYPGGAALDLHAKLGDGSKYQLPRSKPGENPYDMSFSGLKTASLNLINQAQQRGEELDIDSLCASFTSAVSDTLIPRVRMALEQTGYTKLAVAGGVAANSRIRADINALAQEKNVDVFLPPLHLCGDNAAMIGSQAYYEFLAGNTADMSLNAYATKSILGEEI